MLILILCEQVPAIVKAGGGYYAGRGGVPASGFSALVIIAVFDLVRPIFGFHFYEAVFGIPGVMVSVIVEQVAIGIVGGVFWLLLVALQFRVLVEGVAFLEHVGFLAIGFGEELSSVAD